MSDEPRDGTTADGTPGDLGQPGSPRPDAAEPSPAPSAPWERPRRWNHDALDATRVDDLLAKLGDGDEVPSGRRRRRQVNSPDGTAVSASALIAALSGDNPATGDNPADPQANPLVAHHSSDQPAAASAPAPAPDDATAALASGAASAPATGGSAEHSVPLPPRIGPGDKAPIRDLGDGPRTDYIPKMTGRVADRAEAESILASLRQQSQTAAGAYGAPAYGAPAYGAAVYGAALYGAAGTGGGTTPPPSTPTGRTSGHGPSDPPPRRRRGLLNTGRGIAAAVALITLLGMGVEWQIKERADAGLLANAVTGALNSNDPNISSARTAPQVVTNSLGVKSTQGASPKANYSPENILLLGSDTRSGSNGDAGNRGAGTNGTANADTMMVAHISGDRSHVTILSIPRDTLIPAPKCKVWNATTGVVSDQYQPITATEIYHINSAYSVGGPTCSVTAVQSLTHLGITRMIGIDFSGFQAMVDALGGINVNICRPIIDTVLGTVVPTAGEQTILGVQALNLVRARDVIGDSLSDLARIRRQQVVLSAILRQVTQAGTLLNPVKLNNFLQAFTRNTFTQNVKVEDLVTLAGSLGSLDPTHVTFYTLPTVPSTVIDGALDVDQAKAPAIFDDLINDLPLPGEVTTVATTKASPTPTPTPAAPSLKITVAPSRVNLEIYNLSGQANIATTAQQKLNAVGFKVSDSQLFKPDSGSQTGSTVLFAAANRAAALTVAAAVPGSTLVLTPGLGKTVRLNLGSSYTGEVNAVRVGGTAPSSLATVSTGSSISTTAASGTSPSVALSSVNAGASTCV